MISYHCVTSGHKCNKMLSVCVCRKSKNEKKEGIFTCMYYFTLVVRELMRSERYLAQKMRIKYFFMTSNNNNMHTQRIKEKDMK